jgi:hypothetical protein
VRVCNFIDPPKQKEAVMTTIVAAEQVRPRVTQEPQKAFTPANHPHSDLGRAFVSVNQNFIGPGALRPSQKGEFAEEEEVYVYGYFHRITSIYDFLQQLQIDASAGFSGTGVGASGSLTFVRNLHITEENFFIAAHLHVGKSKQTINSATFATDAVESTPEKFLRGFGDQYCSTIHWGGELFVLYTLYARSRLEQMSLDARLDGHYGPVTASSQLSFKTQILNKEVTLDISLGIWGLADKIEAEKFDMQKFILDFPTKVRDRGHVTHREFSYYWGVKGAPSTFRVPDISRNKDKLNEAADLIKQLDEYVPELNYRIQYPFLFKPFDKDKWKETIKALTEQRKQIDTITKQLIDAGGT